MTTSLLFVFLYKHERIIKQDVLDTVTIFFCFFLRFDQSNFVHISKVSNPIKINHYFGESACAMSFINATYLSLIKYFPPSK
jgi:hypothetical protein